MKRKGVETALAIVVVLVVLIILAVVLTTISNKSVTQAGGDAGEEVGSGFDTLEEQGLRAGCPPGTKRAAPDQPCT